MHKVPRRETPWEGCVPIQPKPVIRPVTWCRWFCHFTKRLSKLGYGWIPSSSTIPQPLGQTWKWTVHKQVFISMMLPLTEIFQFPIPSQRTPVTDSINCPSLLSRSLPPAQIKQIAPHSSDTPSIRDDHLRTELHWGPTPCTMLSPQQVLRMFKDLSLQNQIMCTFGSLAY